MNRRKSSLCFLGLLMVAGCGDDPQLIGSTELAKACVASAACSVEARPSVAQCMDNYLGLLTRRGEGELFGEIYRCTVSAHGDCDAVRSCFGAGEECSRDSYRASCSGNTAIECDLLDHRVYRRQCGDVGLHCQVDSTQPFAADCVCDSSYGRRCSGGYALRCDGDQVVGDDCAALGQRCSDGRCKGSAESCDGKTPPSCDGTVAVSCVDKQLVRLDCAKLALKGGCSQGSCIPLGNACSDEFNRCTSDGQLEACINGSWKRFDCAAMGLEPCAEAQYGANCSERLPTQ